MLHVKSKTSASNEENVGGRWSRTLSSTRVRLGNCGVANGYKFLPFVAGVCGVNDGSECTGCQKWRASLAFSVDMRFAIICGGKFGDDGHQKLGLWYSRIC